MAEQLRLEKRETVLEMHGVTKRFPGVWALDNVDFDLKRGEVHVLLGENGAGKSTLIKILSGAYSLDKGAIVLQGRNVKIHNPKHAQELGISVIYQEFNLVPSLSVAENIFLGREPMQLAKFINTQKIQEESRRILKELNIDLDPAVRVASLGVAMQQMVEVAKALSMDAEIIVMDEPTAALGEHEIAELFATIRRLKEKNVSIIYISHRLQELAEIADRITVLRDGQNVMTTAMADTDLNTLIKHMVGRTLSEQFPKAPVQPGAEILRVQNLSCAKKLHNITFSLRRGEILGISGLVGSGRTELMRCLFGVEPYDTGAVFLEGKEVRIRSAKQAVRMGLGFLTEDRKKQGLFLGLSVQENITITNLDRIKKGIFLNYQKESAVGEEYVGSLHIKTPSLQQLARNLSGGNQQKVVLAKWLYAQARLMIFDEPTRGIDVGAKVEVYNLMNQLVKSGVGVIMISSELPEILGMSDRILVMCQGSVSGEFARADATQEKILKCATIRSGGNGSKN